MDFVSRLIRGITGIVRWLVRIFNLLTKSHDPASTLNPKP